MSFVSIRKHLRPYNAAYQLTHGREGQYVWPLSDGCSPHTIGGPTVTYVTACISPAATQRRHGDQAPPLHLAALMRSCANRTAIRYDTPRMNLLPIPPPFFPLWLIRVPRRQTHHRSGCRATSRRSAHAAPLFLFCKSRRGGVGGSKVWDALARSIAAAYS